MKKTVLATLSMAAALASAQTYLTPPQAGLMRDAANSLRPVYGIAGNFVVGDQVLGPVISAAYSGSYGLVKTSSAILVIDKTGSIVANTATADGPALFAFTLAGEPSLVYLPAAGTLLAWNAGAFGAVPFDPTTLAANAVLSIATPPGGDATIIVQRDDGLWDVQIDLATGAIDAQTAIPGIVAPVVMLATGELVYSETDGINGAAIVLRAPDGSERHISASLPASFEFEQMDLNWIQLRDLAAGQQFAIRITQNREQFYQLPEVGQ